MASRAAQRVPPTGAPSAYAAASPVYTDNATINTDRAMAGSARVYTGRIAVPRAQASAIIPQVIGRQIAFATGADVDESIALARDYRSRTGAYPDLTALGQRTGAVYDADQLNRYFAEGGKNPSADLPTTWGGSFSDVDMTAQDAGLSPIPGAFGMDAAGRAGAAGSGGLFQAGVLGGLNMWLILSAAGVVLLLFYGKRK